MRLSLIALLLFVVSIRGQEKDAKPSLKETAKYIEEKAKEVDRWPAISRLPDEYVYFSSGAYFPSGEPKITSYLAGYHLKKLPKEGETPYDSGTTVERYEVEFKSLNPDTVRVVASNRSRTSQPNSQPLADTVYRVVADSTIDQRDDDPRPPALVLWLGDEKTAVSVARALKHAIVLSGGKPGVTRRTDVFEKPDGEPIPIAKSGQSSAPVAALPSVVAAPPVAALPPAAPVELPKPVGDEQKAAARKFVEKQLVDAEAELLTATQQDATNRAANDARRAALRKQLDDVNAQVRAANAKGDKATAAAGILFALTLNADLQDEYKWAKDTGAAARVQTRITALRRQLIDLRD